MELGPIIKLPHHPYSNCYFFPLTTSVSVLTCDKVPSFPNEPKKKVILIMYKKAFTALS